MKIMMLILSVLMVSGSTFADTKIVRGEGRSTGFCVYNQSIRFCIDHEARSAERDCERDAERSCRRLGGKPGFAQCRTRCAVSPYNPAPGQTVYVRCQSRGDVRCRM